MDLTITYFFVVIAFLPLISPEQYRRQASYFSLLLCFLIMGFQYQLPVDWDVNVSRWLSVNFSQSYSTSVELEPIYKFILYCSKPITCYGFFIATAFFFVAVIFLYLRKFVVWEYAYIFFFIFVFDVNNCLWLSNSNRQTWAIMFVLLAVFIMSSIPEANLRNKNFYISLGFMVMAVFTHRSALIALPILAAPFYVEYIENEKPLYIFVVIDVLSFFVDFSSFSLMTDMFLSGNTYLEEYAHYSEEVSSRAKSIIEQGLYMLTTFLLIKNFNEFSKEERVIAIGAMFFFALQGFFMYNMLRSLLYFRILVAFAVPILYIRNAESDEVSELRKRFYQFFIVIFLSYMIYRYNIDIYCGNYDNYVNFKTLFEVHDWI